MTNNHFDTASADYEEVLAHNLRFIPGDTSHYYLNRARIAARSIADPRAVKRVLDFGGGIGLAYPHLRREFPNAEILLFDTSAASVALALETFDGLKAVDSSSLSDLQCDLVFVAGVVHHVQRASRAKLMRDLVTCTAVNGSIAIFELNPLNPVTRKLVKMCPFDSDADLLSRRQLRSLIHEVPQIQESDSGFTVFFPPAFKPLLVLEHFMRWIPFGAQYFITLRRTAG
jgi:trans-aconitate methyltransferase